MNFRNMFYDLLSPDIRIKVKIESTISVVDVPDISNTFKPQISTEVDHSARVKIVARTKALCNRGIMNFIYSKLRRYEF